MGQQVLTSKVFGTSTPIRFHRSRYLNYVCASGCIFVRDISRLTRCSRDSFSSRAITPVNRSFLTCIKPISSSLDGELYISIRGSRYKLQSHIGDTSIANSGVDQYNLATSKFIIVGFYIVS
ncbi:MAG: hypothetical protein BWY95_02705 [Bacteroidetes bacterium ADurb.BinA104]|nr:MAG: hypothetical protein BWY95_02705 [Bacteroidetes bacterium ADurb.BinA104]